MLPKDEIEELELDAVDIDEIGNELLGSKEVLEYFNTDKNQNLIRLLYKNKDEIPVLGMALESIIEHMSVITMTSRNLLDAASLLEQRGIPFNCIIDTERDPNE